MVCKAPLAIINGHIAPPPWSGDHMLSGSALQLVVAFGGHMNAIFNGVFLLVFGISFAGNQQKKPIQMNGSA